MLRGWRLTRHHLHLHSARQKELLLLVLQRVGALNGLAGLLHHVVLHRLGRAGASLVVRHSRGRTLRLLLVVLVKLLNVQTAAALVHVHLPVHRTLDLNRLRPVSLLGVELTAVHSLDVHDVTLVVLPSCAVGRGHDRLAGRVVTEVRLVHQLVVERRINSRVVVLYGLLVVCHAVLVDLRPVFEELVQN